MGGSKVKVWEVVQKSRVCLKEGNNLKGEEKMERGKPGVEEAEVWAWRCQGGWTQDRKRGQTHKPYHIV